MSIDACLKEMASYHRWNENLFIKCATFILYMRKEINFTVMSKETLNLSIEKSIKKRAKEIARKKGISLSRYFEKLIVRQEEDEYFTPPPGSAAAKLANIISESEKVNDYDYKKET